MSLKLTIARVSGRGPASASLNGAALSAIVAIDRDGLVRVVDSAFDEAATGAEGLHSLVLSAEQGHWNAVAGQQALLNCLGFDDWAVLRKAIGGKGRVRAEIVGREG